MTQSTATPGLLGDSDPPAVEVLAADSDYPVVLVCEHAGRAIPAKLNKLGVDSEHLQKHIAWDLGAGLLARALAAQLGAPLALQHYSRLVVDCNRPPQAQDSMPAISDGIAIPGNSALTGVDRAQRIDEIFTPFQTTVADLLDTKPRRAVFSLHSFTPVFGGQSRPWNIGFLFRNDRDTSMALATAIQQTDPALLIGMNQPYSIDDESDWFVPVQCEPRNIAHSLIEIRNDQLGSADDCERWANLLAGAIRKVVPE